MIRQYTGNPVIHLTDFLLLAFSLLVPAHAGVTDSYGISRAALQCSAIFHVMGSLSERDDNTARLVSRLGQTMDDLYIYHAGQVMGRTLTDSDMADAKQRAVNELTEQYRSDPARIESDYLRCDDWSVAMEQHYANVAPYQDKKDTILTLPSPRPRDDFSGETDHDVKRLLRVAFERWKLKENPLPVDDYLQSVTDEISRVCLRAWPAQMLQDLAGVTDIPPTIDANPSLQIRYLLRRSAAHEKGTFFPTGLHQVLAALRGVVGPGKRFLDLGSGDGRVVFLANALGADATGIEFEAELIEVSRKALRGLEGVVDRDQLHLIQGDFFAVPWSSYDIVFYYALGSFEEQRIWKKIATELAPGAIFIVNRQTAPISGMELVREFPAVKVLRKAAGKGHE